MNDTTRYDEKNNAALALLASRVALTTALTTTTGNEERDVVWVSMSGSDANDGSYDRPMATFAAAVAKVCPAPSNAAEFSRLRHVRTRGPVPDGAGQPPIVAPTARLAFTLHSGTRMPQIRVNPLESERFATAFPASYHFHGDGNAAENTCEIHGTATAPSVVVAASAGDVIADLLLSFDGVACLGPVQKLALTPDPLVATFASRNSAYAAGVSAPWAQPFFFGGPSVLHALSRFAAPTVLDGVVFGADCVFSTGNTGSMGTQGLGGCRAYQPVDLRVLDGGEIWMDTDTAHRLIQGGCTVSAAGPGQGVTRVLGDERLGEGNPAPGEQRSRHAWVSGRGSDNPLRSIFHGSAQFPYATLAAALAELAPPPQDKDDYQCEVTLSLAPGVHLGAGGTGRITIEGLSCVRLVLHGAEIPGGLQWNTLNSYRFGETEPPLLDIVGIGHQPRGAGEVGEIGDATAAAIIQTTAPGDVVQAELRLQNVRLRGGFEQDANHVFGQPNAFLRWRDVQCSPSAPNPSVLAPTAVCDWDRVVATRQVTVQNWSQGMRECRFTESIVADAGSGAGQTIGHMRGCEFTIGAGKSITLTAPNVLGMDGVTNGNLKRAGWAVHPAGAVVDLLDDTVAPVVPT